MTLSSNLVQRKASEPASSRQWEHRPSVEPLQETIDMPIGLSLLKRLLISSLSIYSVAYVIWRIVPQI